MKATHSPRLFLLSAVRAFGLPLLGIVVLSWLAAFAAAYGVLMLQKLLDALAAAKQAQQPVTQMLAWYALWRLVHVLSEYALEYPLQHLSQSLYQWVKISALQKVAQLPYETYVRYGTGELLQLVEQGAVATRDLICNYYARVIREILPTLLFTVAFLVSLDGQLVLVLCLGYAIVSLATLVCLPLLRNRKSLSLADETAFSRYFVRAIMESLILKLYGAFEQETSQLTRIGKRIASAKAQIGALHELMFCLFALFVLITEIVVIWQQSGQVIAGTMSLGSLVATITLLSRVYQPIAIFSVLRVGAQLNQVAYKRLMALFSEARTPEADEGDWPDNFANGLSFEAVGYAHADKEILKAVSLTVSSGERVVLVGPSGSGKSTLLRLAMGILKASKGVVRWGQHEMARLADAKLFSKVFFLPQDGSIFDGTVRENLEIGLKRAPSIERMRETLCRLRLGHLALSSEVGERGCLLSGGERQRLALCRILLRSPQALILDEPTSGLDAQNSALFWEVLFECFPNCALLLSTHQEEALKYADRIVSLLGGRVVSDNLQSKVAAS